MHFGSQDCFKVASKLTRETTSDAIFTFFREPWFWTTLHWFWCIFRVPLTMKRTRNHDKTWLWNNTENNTCETSVFCENVLKHTPKWPPKMWVDIGENHTGVPRVAYLISSGKKCSPGPPKVTPKNEKRCQKGSWIHTKVQKGGTKAVKHNLFPWHSGLSEAVAAARRTARSGVRTKARRTARSAYNNYSLIIERRSTDYRISDKHLINLLV